VNFWTVVKVPRPPYPITPSGRRDPGAVEGPGVLALIQIKTARGSQMQSYFLDGVSGSAIPVISAIRGTEFNGTLALGLLTFDVGRFDDRPPLFDSLLDERAKRVRGLAGDKAKLDRVASDDENDRDG